MALGLGDQGLKLVLTSGVEAQSSENIDEDPLKFLVFRVERRHLDFFCYLCEKQIMCLLFMTIKQVQGRINQTY